MRLLVPTQHKRLNEAAGLVLLSVGLFLWLSLVSYQAQDPSWNSAAGPARPLNLTGYVGSYLSDLLLQAFGLAAFALPALVLLLAWRWLRSNVVPAPTAKVIGSILLLLSLGSALSLLPHWRLYGGAILPGGVFGLLLADYLLGSLNLVGAILIDITGLMISIYLISTFTMETAAVWFAPITRLFAQLAAAWAAWKQRFAERRAQKLATRLEQAKAAQVRRTAVVEKPAEKKRPAPEPQPEFVEEPAASFDEIPICPMPDAPP